MIIFQDNVLGVLQNVGAPDPLVRTFAVHHMSSDLVGGSWLGVCGWRWCGDRGGKEGGGWE